MRQREVVLGATYSAQVSGRVVPVRILRESPYGGWDGENVWTGRSVRIRSAQRLRQPVERCPRCDRWGTLRWIAAHEDPR
jgi:hypothetical protein